jgi:hypothetical protein
MTNVRDWLNPSEITKPFELVSASGRRLLEIRTFSMDLLKRLSVELAIAYPLTILCVNIPTILNQELLTVSRTLSDV